MTCKSCGAAVIWAKTGNGRAISIDPAQVPGGNIDLIGREVVVRKADPRRFGYVSHFTTCPDRDRHRKPKEPVQADLFGGKR